MTINNNIPTVSDKDTKGTIIEKFNQVVALLKAQNAAKLDPAKEVAQKAVASTLEKAATVVKADVGTQINEMASTVTDALAKALAEINTRVANYKELDDAISLKKAELEELFEIESSAFALVALINMQEEQKASFDATMAERKEQANAQLQAIIAETQERRATFQQEMAQLKKETDAARTREKEEYDYNLQRDRKIENDKWEDTKAARRKEFNAELEAKQAEYDAETIELGKREEAVTARETKMEELEAKVAEIPFLIEAATAKAAKDAKSAADTSNGFEVRALKKDAEAAKALSDMRISNLEKALDDEKARSAALEAKLDDAYVKIGSISGKAVDAAAGVKYMDRIEGMAKETGKLSAAK